MKIKFGAIVVDGRGKLGGHVASKNRSGSYLRTKVTPSNPQTIAQTLVRTIFGAISAGWSALTAAQIAAWNNAVDDFTSTDIFGDIKKPSGKALYQKLNNNLILVGESALSTPPVKLSLPDDVVTAATIDLTASTLTLTGANTTAGNFIVVSATPPLSEGTSFSKNRMRNIYTAEASTFVDADAYTAYVTKYGAPAAGANLRIGVEYVVASGQRSVQQTVKAVVNA